MATPTRKYTDAELIEMSRDPRYLNPTTYRVALREQGLHGIDRQADADFLDACVTIRHLLTAAAADHDPQRNYAGRAALCAQQIGHTIAHFQPGRA